jgi:hypothetical protein
MCGQGFLPQSAEQCVALCYWAGTMLRKLWRTWLHGLCVTLLSGLGALTAMVIASIPLAILGGLLRDPDGGDALLWLAGIVWLPLGVGLIWRYLSTDDLRGRDYPEPDSRIAQTLRNVHRGGDR